MTQIYAIANQKGGVGKTTTAVNLAAYLANKNRKVLIIDLDPQTNASTGLNLNVESLENSVYHAIFHPQDAPLLIQKTSIDHLFALAGSMSLAGIEIELAQQEGREFFLQKMIQDIQRDFDMILIDCPPALGLLTINALTAAQGVIVPLQCEYYALEGVSHLIRTIGAVKQKFNPLLDISAILLTMYDGRAKLTQMVEDDVRNHFGDRVFKTVIPRNVRLSEAPSHGLPILKYDPSASGGKAYKNLAKEFVARLNKAQAAELK